MGRVPVVRDCVTRRAQFRYANGDSYEGEWADDMPHGALRPVPETGPAPGGAKQMQGGGVRTEDGRAYKV